MSTAAQAINNVISKSRDAIGSASVFNDVISSIPGVPSELKGAISSLFNTGRAIPSQENRRDLNNFLSTTSKLNGFSRPAYFYVEIGRPKSLGSVIEAMPYIPYLSESTSLPGVSLSTSDVRRYGIGPTEKKPYAPTFVDTTMTFYCDASGIIQKFFYKWINSIVRFDSPITSNIPQSLTSDIGPYEVNYKSEYAVDIKITTVNEQHKTILTTRLYNAFPIFMGDINLGWGDVDSIARLPVTFTYYNWAFEEINLNELQIKAPQEGIIQKLIKTGTAIQTLASLRKPNNVADILNVVNNAKIIIGGI